jgi:hypothetical protein
VNANASTASAAEPITVGFGSVDRSDERGEPECSNSDEATIHWVSSKFESV